MIELMEHFKEQKIAFVSLKENIDTSSARGKLIFNIFASLGLRGCSCKRKKRGKDEEAIKRTLKLYESKEYTIKK